MGGRVNGLRMILATRVRVGLGTDERGLVFFSIPTTLIVLSIPSSQSIPQIITHA